MALPPRRLECGNREAAKECSPRRKPWVKNVKCQRPESRKMKGRKNSLYTALVLRVEILDDQAFVVGDDRDFVLH